MANMDTSSAVSDEPCATEGQKPRKKRVRNWTPADRALHRVFEKERREAFNERMLELARLLPRLATVQKSRLSKHVIVDESIEQSKAQSAALAAAAVGIRELLLERDGLLQEVNQWRVYNRMAQCQPSALDNTLLELLKLESKISTPLSSVSNDNDSFADEYDHDYAASSIGRTASDGSERDMSRVDGNARHLSMHGEAFPRQSIPLAAVATPTRLAMPTEPFISNDHFPAQMTGALHTTAALPVTAVAPNPGTHSTWAFTGDQSLPYTMAQPAGFHNGVWSAPVQYSYNHPPPHVPSHESNAYHMQPSDTHHVASQVPNSQTEWYA